MFNPAAPRHLLPRNSASIHSHSSSSVSIHSSLFTRQDGPFPFLPPPDQVQANLERQAALSSSLSMPDRAGDHHGAYPVQHVQDPFNGEIPDYPNPHDSQHGMLHNSDTFGMVRSDQNLPRGVSQFQSVGANPSVARGLTPNNPDRSCDGKKKDVGARSKVKSFLDKFAVRRRYANTDAVVPLNDTESTSGVEPFPDFYSVGRRNANNEGQTASRGARNTDGKSKAPVGITRRSRRASWSSSGRRVPRRSMFSTLKSRITAFLTNKNKPVKRGRTWEPSKRRSTNPFSPFRRRNAGLTRDSEMFASQPAMTGARMI